MNHQRPFMTAEKCHGLIPADKLVQRFNQLNAQIAHQHPEFVRASDALQRYLPLLQEMQRLLSQRPKGTPTPSTCLYNERVGGRVFTKSVPVAFLPTWSQWLSEFAQATNYSMRHLRRKMFNEAPQRVTKECGWPAAMHNNALRAVSLLHDIVTGIESAADVTALLQEAHDLRRGTPDSYEPVDKPIKRKKRAQLVTE
jgi:hypothetical protein